MKCERYWREGILLVERGQPDPHRDTCLDCRRAHESRHELISALPLVGAGHTGDPQWQARVWSQIARDRPSRSPFLRRWLVGGMAAAACAIAVVCLYHHEPTSGDARPRIETISGEVVMRGTSVHVGDRVRVAMNADDEVHIYRAERLVMRCPAPGGSEGCTPDRDGTIAEMVLAIPGEYQVVVIRSRTFEPLGTLDRDLGALISAGIAYERKDLTVR